MIVIPPGRGTIRFGSAVIQDLRGERSTIDVIDPAQRSHHIPEPLS